MLLTVSSKSSGKVIGAGRDRRRVRLRDVKSHVWLSLDAEKGPHSLGLLVVTITLRQKKAYDQKYTTK